MGSTPVARGSSVPAWPTRLARVTLRIWATTENDVAPAGLLTLRTPGRIRELPRSGVPGSRFALVWGAPPPRNESCQGTLRLSGGHAPPDRRGPWHFGKGPPVGLSVPRPRGPPEIAVLGCG